MLVNKSIVDNIVDELPSTKEELIESLGIHMEGIISSNHNIAQLIDSYSKTLAETFADSSESEYVHSWLIVYVAWGMIAVARAFETQAAQNLQGIKRCLWCGQMIDDKQLFCPKCNNPTVNILGEDEPPEPDPDSIRDDEEYQQYLEEQLKGLDNEVYGEELPF